MLRIPTSSLFNIFTLDARIKKIFKILILSLVISLSVIIGYKFIGFASNNIISKDLTPKPEPFTELYFLNHQDLPSLVSSEKIIQFEFVIHNVEHKDVDYTYEVYLDTLGERRFIDANVISLKHNQSEVVSEKYILENVYTRSAIVINLTNKMQQIDFWLGVEE